VPWKKHEGIHSNDTIWYIIQYNVIGFYNRDETHFLFHNVTFWFLYYSHFTYRVC
jgi:hypothetical protein